MQQQCLRYSMLQQLVPCSTSATPAGALQPAVTACCTIWCPAAPAGAALQAALAGARQIPCQARNTLPTNSWQRLPQHNGTRHRTLENSGPLRQDLPGPPRTIHAAWCGMHVSGIVHDLRQTRCQHTNRATRPGSSTLATNIIKEQYNTCCTTDEPQSLRLHPQTYQVLIPLRHVVKLYACTSSSCCRSTT
jgi:hypothetical protein